VQKEVHSVHRTGIHRDPQYATAVLKLNSLIPIKTHVLSPFI